MKIAVIYPEFIGPYGGERHAVRMMNELSKNNDIHLYTPSITNDWKNQLDSKVKLIESGRIKIPWHNIKTFMQLLWMRKVKLKDDYDFIFCFQWQSVHAGARNKEHGKIVYFCNEQPLAHAFTLKKPLAKLLLYPGFKLADNVFRNSLKHVSLAVSNSEWTQKALKDNYGIGSHVSYSIVDVKRFKRFDKKKCRKELGLGGDVYISVSKLHKRKQLDKVIKYYAKQKAKNKSLIIIGKGPEEKNLKKLVQDLGVDNVSFKGEVLGDLLVKYLRASDYFIFMGKDEPYGQAPLEAKVAGCKVVPKDHDKKIQDVEEKCKDIIRLLRQAK
ncbi:glycosyltransferase [Nanoarchaeota archaeon]